METLDITRTIVLDGSDKCAKDLLEVFAELCNKELNAFKKSCLKNVLEEATHAMINTLGGPTNLPHDWEQKFNAHEEKKKTIVGALLKKILIEEKLGTDVMHANKDFCIIALIQVIDLFVSKGMDLDDLIKYLKLSKIEGKITC